MIRMKYTVLIAAYVFQTVFPSTYCSEFRLSIDIPHNKVKGTPQGVSDFNPSDQSIAAEVQGNGETEIVKNVDPYSPLKHHRKSLVSGKNTASGRFTPLKEVISAVTATAEDQEAGPFMARKLSKVSSNKSEESESDDFSSDNEEEQDPEIAELTQSLGERINLSDEVIDNNLLEVIKDSKVVRERVPSVTVSDVDSDDSDYELYVPKQVVEDFDYDKDDESIFINPRRHEEPQVVNRKGVKKNVKEAEPVREESRKTESKKAETDRKAESSKVLKQRVPSVIVSDVNSDDSDYELYVPKQVVEDFDYDKDDESIFINHRRHEEPQEVKRKGVKKNVKEAEPVREKSRKTESKKAETVRKAEPSKDAEKENASSIPTASKAAADPSDLINLSDYSTVQDILGLSRERRVTIFIKLCDQMLKSMNFASSVTLSDIPPVLFLLKVSFTIRRFCGNHLTDEELVDERALLDVINKSFKKMKLADRIDVIENLYRARKTRIAKNLLYKVVIPHIRKLSPVKTGKEPSDYVKFLHLLAVKGYICTLTSLLSEGTVSNIIHRTLGNSDIILLVQTVFNDGWASDAEALDVMNILLKGRDRVEFIQKYGAELVLNLTGKRGENFMSIFPKPEVFEEDALEQDENEEEEY